jgi:fluoride exporter
VSLLLVFLGGALGAPARYLADRLVQSTVDTVFPLGTLAVNVAGSLVLGALVGAAAVLPPELALLLGTGFCGALTTFSSFSFETVRLIERGAFRAAGLNVFGSLILGVVAATVGYAAAAGLT